jgi:hypothetical protein
MAVEDQGGAAALQAALTSRRRRAGGSAAACRYASRQGFEVARDSRARGLGDDTPLGDQCADCLRSPTAAAADLAVRRTPWQPLLHGTFVSKRSSHLFLPHINARWGRTLLHPAPIPATRHPVPHKSATRSRLTRPGRSHWGSTAVASQHRPEPSGGGGGVEGGDEEGGGAEARGGDVLGADEVGGGAAVDRGREDERRPLHPVDRVHVVLRRPAKRGAVLSTARPLPTPTMCSTETHSQEVMLGAARRRRESRAGGAGQAGGRPWWCWVCLPAPSAVGVAAAAQHRAHCRRGPIRPRATSGNATALRGVASAPLRGVSRTRARAHINQQRGARTCTTVSTIPLSKACVAASTTCSVASSSASAPDLPRPPPRLSASNRRKGGGGDGVGAVGNSRKIWSGGGTG